MKVSSSKKIKAINNKLSKTKLYRDEKLLIFQLYHQEMSVNMNFWLTNMFYQKKTLLEKAVTMKRFEYSPLGNELKTQTDIAKK